MITKMVKVVNEQGLHMRPAGLLAQEMKKFPGCIVTLKTADKEIKATSVMQVMAAGLKCGSEIELCADGENEKEALAKAAQLFEDGFGE